MGNCLFWWVLLLMANACSRTLSEKVVLSRSLDSDGGKRLVVLDDVLSKKTVDQLSEVVMHRKTGSVWQYALGDAEPEPLNIVRYRDARWPWMSRINASLVDRSSTGEIMKGLAKRFSALAGYRVSEVVGYLLRRGDSVYRTVADSSDDSALVVHVELSGRPWRKNDYGETLFFGVSENAKSGKVEVEEAVHLKRGRIILWHASIPFTLRPPSMNYAQARCGMLLLLTRDSERVNEAHKQYEEAHQILMQRQMKPFVNTDVPPTMTAEDVMKHKKREFHDGQGRVVAIFDDVFARDDVLRLRNYLLKSHASFHYQLHDAVEEEYSDNVQWVAGFQVDLFIKTGFWEVTQAVAEVVTNKTAWYPYDIALNIVRSGDYTRIHKDCDGNEEEEYTMLIYINDDVSANAHGETAFFNEVSREPKNSKSRFQEEFAELLPEEEEEQGGEDNEEGQASSKTSYDLFAAVRPLFGRIVIFHGAIPHSARPPSTDFSNIRYSFAVKLSETEQLAKAKTLREVLEGGYSRETRHMSPEQERLHERLTEGQLDATKRYHLPDVPELDDLLQRERAGLLLLRQSQQKSLEEAI